MTDLNTDKCHEYGKEYHDEFETDFHAHEENDPNLGEQAEWEKRHADKTLDIYCDTHPSAPECRVYDD